LDRSEHDVAPAGQPCAAPRYVLRVDAASTVVHRHHHLHLASPYSPYPPPRFPTSQVVLVEHSLTHGVGRNDGIGSSMLLPRWSLYEGAALSYKFYNASIFHSDATAIALEEHWIGVPPTVDTTVIDEHNQHHYKTQIGMVMNIANAQASEEYDLTVEGS